VSSNLIALFELGSARVIDLLTGLAAVFCANLSILPKLDSPVNLNSSFLSKTHLLEAATAQNVKTSIRLKIEARSSKLLIPLDLRLGI
jgi:hypothetical protein